MYAVLTVGNDKETGKSTVEVTDKAGKDGATIAEELKGTEIIAEAAEGTEPDCGHTLFHPAINLEVTEAESEELHTSTYEKKTLVTGDPSFPSEKAARIGRLSSATVEDAEGEVSVISAANKSCGASIRVVAKVFVPGD